VDKLNTSITGIQKKGDVLLTTAPLWTQTTGGHTVYAKTVDTKGRMSQGCLRPHKDTEPAWSPQLSGHRARRAMAAHPGGLSTRHY